MKTLIRSFLINALALWILIQIASGIHFAKGWETIFVTAVALALFNLFVRPLLNLLLLPINILTLGAFRWVVNVISLYLLTLIIPGFAISGFAFSGFAFQGLVIPAFSVGLIWAFILISFLLSFITGFFFWLVK